MPRNVKNEKASTVVIRSSAWIIFFNKIKFDENLFSSNSFLEGEMSHGAENIATEDVFS